MTELEASAFGASALALLELDAASFGPFLLSRPFVVGPLAGWALGSPWTGAALGAAFEAVTLRELPLGGRLDLSASVAAGVAAILAAGPAGLPAAAAFPAGLAAGWGHARLERAQRRRRGARAFRAGEALSSGGSPRLGAEISAALALQAAATLAFVFVVLLAAGPALSRLWPALPGAVRAGVRAAFLAAPWLGAGSLAVSLWRRA